MKEIVQPWAGIRPEKQQKQGINTKGGEEQEGVSSSTVCFA